MCLARTRSLRPANLGKTRRVWENGRDVQRNRLQEGALRRSWQHSDGQGNVCPNCKSNTSNAVEQQRAACQTVQFQHYSPHRSGVPHPFTYDQETGACAAPCPAERLPYTMVTTRAVCV